MVHRLGQWFTARVSRESRPPPSAAWAWAPPSSASPTYPPTCPSTDPPTHLRTYPPRRPPQLQQQLQLEARGAPAARPLLRDQAPAAHVLGGLRRGDVLAPHTLRRVLGGRRRAVRRRPRPGTLQGNERLTPAGELRDGSTGHSLRLGVGHCLRVLAQLRAGHSLQHLALDHGCSSASRH